MKTEGYFIEHNGDHWQSVFPEHEAHLSQLHTSVADAKAYFREVKPGARPMVIDKQEK